MNRSPWLLSAVLLWTSCAGVAEPRPFEVERAVAYGAGPRQIGDLYRPALPEPGPALLVIHGGSWARGDRARMDKFAERFAAAGYVVYNVNYRLAPEHPHPAQIEDVRAAFAWLQSHAGEFGVDPARIGAMGYSAGGHLALLLGLSEGEAGAARPAAIASGAAPTDLLAYPRSPLIRSFLGGGPDEEPSAWRAASPLAHVSADDPPVLLYHGTLDRLVGIDQSRRLHARLQEHGVSSRLVERSWTGHFTTYLFDRHVFRDVLAFLDAELD